MNDSRPVGIFDSGLGGLTVARAVARRLPDERIVYLGDTARVPWGTKSAETVTRYAIECAEFLITRDVKTILVACNTASSLAMDPLRARLAPSGIPVLGVIEPGAVEACRVTRRGRIGVIGTASTIRSGAYARAIGQIRPDYSVLGAPCPLFVPLTEEGWTEARDPVTRAVAVRYLEPLLREEIDTLILGCTHYPLLEEVIRAAIRQVRRDGEDADVHLVDSSRAVAHDLQRLLEREEIAAPRAEAQGSGRPDPAARAEYHVTDDPGRFAAIGERFLGHAIAPPRVVRLEDPCTSGAAAPAPTEEKTGASQRAR